MRRLALLLALVATALSVLPQGAVARRTNASAALGFVEDAQNRDGGFGARHGAKSDPVATLWASLALLAGGRNPRDEFLKRGRSADDYLVAHRDRYRSVRELGLLTMIQVGGRFSSALYGNPAARLRSRLDAAAVAEDPGGVALGIIGLIASDGAADRSAASAAAQSLLSSTTTDGGWGPRGNADSASTALVLQALSIAGSLEGQDALVDRAIGYLQAAQTNDGALAESTRVDKATAGGSVPATAFAIQALHQLGRPTLRTPTGKSLEDGLSQYQQRSSGGLTSRGSRYSTVAPSVVETAQAFPAFNGRTLPVPPIASTTGGPDLAPKPKGAGADPHSNRVSAGTARQGISGDAAHAATSDPGAFRRGSARGTRHPAAAAGGRTRAATAPPAKAAGDEVSGTVVGAGPRLATKAGAGAGGLSAEDRAALVLLAGLALVFALGLALERRPAGAAPLRVAVAQGARAGATPVVRAAARVTGVTDARAGRVVAPQRRWPLVLVMALGVGLALVPVGSRMFDRAPQGERMIAAFKPYMTTAKIEAFQRDIALVEGYAREIDGPLPQALHPGARTPESARAALLRERPELALFAQQWPREHRTFVEMLGAMHASRDGYDGVAALPRFGLFPYFLLIAGALLALLAAAGLLLARRAAWLPVQRAVIGLGVALALAPVTLQLFERGPKGADMVEAFRPIENRARVQQVQSSFGTITLGHGAIADALEPALRKGGRSEREIKQDFPAMVELGKRWVPILNAFTPMIGVMSDSVGDYEAVAALPSFRLFPWLFLIPGLAAAALVALCSPAGRRRLPLLARETTEGA